MSEYDLKNIQISGDNAQFGDRYIINSSQDFLNHYDDLNNVEQEIVKGIFNVVEKEKDKQHILKFFQYLIEDRNSKVSTKDKKIWGEFIKKLKDAGLEKLANKAIAYSAAKVPKILEYVGQII